ncbi:MAG: cysteine desulfurase [Bacteroidales bacterium]|nr:cysteine desulfurase [Bacteroidales bacterium]MDY4850597.1 cysteine desulfurase [Paludibacteraceae bacterium]MDY6036112.1 cysteine desulfurase [Paludibacteraceae bacterium]
MSFDIDNIRNDFPILAEKIYGKPLVYLDNAATTQKPRCVLDKITTTYATQNANIHRGIHYLSQKATLAHEAARQAIATFIGARSTNEIVFTRGTTESINLLASVFADRFCRPDDEIVITQMEHHSNIVPWQMAAERHRLHLRVAPIDERGELRLDELEKLLNHRTRLVAVAHISNVLGTVNPVKRIIEMAHAHGAKVLIDGAQAVAHLPVDVADLDADFYAFSGHKIYGPTGIGVLYGKEALLDTLPPYQGGGEMIQNVTFEKTTYNELPYKFEAGTPDFVGSVALAEALNYMDNIGREAIFAHEDHLLRYAEQRLREIPKMRIFGNAADKNSVISFLVGNVHPYDLGMLLDKTGVAVRTGHHCAQPLIDLLGIPGTVRASVAFYNTCNEIDYFVEQLRRCLDILQ